MPQAAKTTTIRASKAAANSLLKTQVYDLLNATRARIDADPQCGHARAFQGVEHDYMAGDYAGAKAGLETIQNAMDARRARHGVESGISETIRLATDRGEEIERGVNQASGSIRILARDGLLWLKQKKRLSTPEAMAAEHYRAVYGVAHRGPTGSSWGASGGGGGSDGCTSRAQVEAMFELDEIQINALHKDGALIWLMDKVVGEGVTLRELAKDDKHQADRLEIELKVALRLTARFKKFLNR